MRNSKRRSGRFLKRRSVRSRRFSRRRGGALDFNRETCKTTFRLKNQGADYSKPRYSACKYRYPGLYREQLDPYDGTTKRHTKWLSRRLKGTKKKLKEELKEWARDKYPTEEVQVSKTVRSDLPGTLPDQISPGPDELPVSSRALPIASPSATGTGYNTPIVPWTPSGATLDANLAEVARKLETKSGGRRSKRRFKKGR